MRALQAALALAGVLGLAWLIQAIGPDALWADAKRLGLGPALAIVAVAAVEHWLHAVGWAFCFPPGLRPGSLRLLGAYLGGLAVNLVTPTATLGGELVRAGLLPRRVRVTEAVASVSADRLAYALADCALGLAGLALLLWRGPFRATARAGLLVAGLLVSAGVGAFFWLQRQGRLTSWLGRHPWLRRFAGDALAERVARGTQEVDTQLATFHAEQRGAFAASLVAHGLGSSVGAIQFALLLHFIGIPAGALAIAQAFLVWTALDLFSFFVPARLGAQEGSRVLAAQMAGLEPSVGLLFSLVLRLEQILWASVGLAFYPWLATRRDRALPA